MEVISKQALFKIKYILIKFRNTLSKNTLQFYFIVKHATILWTLVN